MIIRRRYEQDGVRVIVGMNGKVASPVTVESLSPEAPLATGEVDLSGSSNRESFANEMLCTKHQRNIVLEVLAQAARGEGGDIEEVEDETSAPKRRGRTLREILANPAALRVPDAVIPRIAWIGRSVLFAGRDKSGKSTLISAGASALSAGKPFLGEHTTARDVMWWAGEEAESDYARRFHDFGADPDRIVVLTEADTPHGLRDLVDEVERWRPAVLVLDTLPALARIERVTDPNDSTAWTRLVAPLTAVAHRSDTAVVLLHHSKKAEGGGYRDSTAIGANVDGIIEMETGPADDPTLRKFIVRARWWAESFSVRLDGTAYTRVSGELSRSERIIHYVSANPGQSKSRVADEIGGRKVDAVREIERLLDRGLLTNAGPAGRTELVVSGSTIQHDAFVGPSVVPGTLGQREAGTTPRTTPDGTSEGSYGHGNGGGTVAERSSEPHPFPQRIPREENRERVASEPRLRPTMHGDKPFIDDHPVAAPAVRATP
jgi:hypothetical protein